MEHTDFARAFHDGLELELDSGQVTMHCHHIADLVAPSGSIVACDPLVVPEQDPFTTQIPPGRYPVILSVVHFHNNDDERVACAMLRLSEQTPMTWEMATRPGQEVSALEEGYIFGYGVDSGIGCFMDAATARALIKKMDEQYDYFETIIAELEKTYVHTWSWANITLDPVTGANLVCFSSGLGDGRYASYFGYDGEGTIACLVTDFAVLA